MFPKMIFALFTFLNIFPVTNYWKHMLRVFCVILLCCSCKGQESIANARGTQHGADEWMSIKAKIAIRSVRCSYLRSVCAVSTSGNNARRMKEDRQWITFSLWAWVFDEQEINPPTLLQVDCRITFKPDRYRVACCEMQNAVQNRLSHGFPVDES